MDTLHLVDTEVRDIVAGLKPFDPEIDSIDDFRTATRRLYAAVPPSVQIVVQEHVVPQQDGVAAVRLLIHRPESTNYAENALLPAVIFIHGGGMIAGSPDMLASDNDRLSRQTGAIVIAVQYRLSPEHPFPAPVEDVYSALRWVLCHGHEIGVDQTRVVIYGQSAGGGLAASAVMMARDQKLPKLAGQILLYPMLDPRTGTLEDPHDISNTGQFIHTRNANRFCWNAYRGSADIEQRLLAYFGPALSTNFQDLPPTYIGVGSLDLFLNENINYARALLQASVRCELHVYEGGVHGFDLIQSRNTTSLKSSIESAIGRFLK